MSSGDVPPPPWVAVSAPPSGGDLSAAAAAHITTTAGSPQYHQHHHHHHQQQPVLVNPAFPGAAAATTTPVAGLQHVPQQPLAAGHPVGAPQQFVPPMVVAAQPAGVAPPPTGISPMPPAPVPAVPLAPPPPQPVYTAIPIAPGDAAAVPSGEQLPFPVPQYGGPHHHTLFQQHHPHLHHHLHHHHQTHFHHRQPLLHQPHALYHHHANVHRPAPMMMRPHGGGAPMPPSRPTHRHANPPAHQAPLETQPVVVAQYSGEPQLFVTHASLAELYAEKFPTSPPLAPRAFVQHRPVLEPPPQPPSVEGRAAADTRDTQLMAMQDSDAADGVAVPPPHVGPTTEIPGSVGPEDGEPAKEVAAGDVAAAAAELDDGSGAAATWDAAEVDGDDEGAMGSRYARRRRGRRRAASHAFRLMVVPTQLCRTAGSAEEPSDKESNAGGDDPLLVFPIHWPLTDADRLHVVALHVPAARITWEPPRDRKRVLYLCPDCHPWLPQASLAAPFPPVDSPTSPAECPRGDQCKFVHTDLDSAEMAALTTDGPHLNVLWGSMDCVPYPMYGAGRRYQVFEAQARDRSGKFKSDHIPSERLLVTLAFYFAEKNAEEGTNDAGSMLRHCGKFQIHGECPYGSRCTAVHAVRLAHEPRTPAAMTLSAKAERAMRRQRERVEHIPAVATAATGDSIVADHDVRDASEAADEAVVLGPIEAPASAVTALSDGGGAPSDSDADWRPLVGRA